MTADLTTEPGARSSSPERFDAIIIGTGQAGPALAGRLTGAGMTVAIIERGLVGGTCVNTGCTPTKAMIASAYVARTCARAAEYGVMLAGPLQVDMPAIADRTAAISGASRTGLERWLGAMERCTLIRGHARFVAPREIRVGERHLRGEKIFVNVGARAAVPDWPGVADVQYLTNTDMVSLRELPRHLVIIGGSYIGLEFGQMFRRFGSQVTIVERAPRLIPREDHDICEEMKSILQAEGIALRLSAECIRLAPHAEGIAVGVDCTEGAPEVIGSHVLLAVGRRSNTDDLGLEAAGIACDGAGNIRVDDQLRTNVPGVWALGDCNGRGGFTHTAYNDYQIVAANLLDGESRSVADRITAYALYTDPPLGRVGMTLAQAQASGRRVKVGTRPMTRVARAVEKGEAKGLMRVVVDAQTDKILGGTILGPGGDEAVHEILAAMAAGTTANGLSRMMAIHPTVSELIPTICGELSEPERDEKA
jgi:pyruvate/2-oxoglutarate dehydrogenase complex dihydrolipoamide dehydrogenase (E3) component